MNVLKHLSMVQRYIVFLALMSVVLFVIAIIITMVAMTMYIYLGDWVILTFIMLVSIIAYPMHVSFMKFAKWAREIT